MKTHDNYRLHGGVKMKKNRHARVKVVKEHSIGISQTTDDVDVLKQEEEARIFRESVMHVLQNDLKRE